MESKPASFDKPQRESGAGLTHRAFLNAASTPRVARSLSALRGSARGAHASRPGIRAGRARGAGRGAGAPEPEAGCWARAPARRGQMES